MMARYIDLRSDTVTAPTEDMRRAMADCGVGDDVYGDDPTVNRLEALAAETLGKEAALFVPSGTMGNQLAIMTHTRRGNEIIVGSNSHIVQHEAGAAAVLSGVSYHMVAREDWALYPEDVARGVRSENIHHPETGLVCVENALSNGRVVPLSVMDGVYAEARGRNVPVHLDGARLFNAAAALGVTAADIAARADSVMFCVSKGLCAPVGSLLCGGEEFVARARRNRKILGGGMRQAGVLAACGILAIEVMTKRLREDHENARYMAARLQEVGGVEVDAAAVQINMIFFRVNRAGFDHGGFVNYMTEHGVKMNADEHGEYRFVTHNDISREDIDRVIELMQEAVAR